MGGYMGGCCAVCLRKGWWNAGLFGMHYTLLTTSSPPHPLHIKPAPPRPPQEEFERERAMVDAVVRRIEEEEAAEEEARRRQQRGVQADIQSFLAQQQELKKRCGRPWRAGWAGCLGGLGWWVVGG